MKPRVLLHSKTLNPAVSFRLAPAVKMYVYISKLDGSNSYLYIVSK